VRQVTIRDVAELAGVSIATVSHSLSGNRPVSPETAARVLAAVDQLDYRPNRVAASMVTRKTRTIALVVPDIANPFFASLVKAVESAAIEREYTTIACSSDANSNLEERYLDLLVDEQVDALIYDGDHRRLSQRLERLAERGTAVVVVDRVDRVVPEMFASVTVDNAAGGSLVARHLVDLGHRHVAMVAGPHDVSTSEPRVRGFRSTLKKHGIRLAESMVCHAEDLTLEAGVQAVEHLLAIDPTITALFCENDLVALGSIRVARQLGLEVPGDISIVGFDDIFVSSLVSPALTTVRQPVGDIGALAVDIALQLMNTSEPTRAVLPVELIARESSGPPKTLREGAAEAVRRGASGERGSHGPALRGSQGRRSHRLS